jgi:hypothetical protein
MRRVGREQYELLWLACGWVEVREEGGMRIQMIDFVLLAMFKIRSPNSEFP